MKKNKALVKRLLAEIPDVKPSVTIEDVWRLRLEKKYKKAKGITKNFRDIGHRRWKRVRVSVFNTNKWLYYLKRNAQGLCRTCPGKLDDASLSLCSKCRNKNNDVIS